MLMNYIQNLQIYCAWCYLGIIFCYFSVSPCNTMLSYYKVTKTWDFRHFENGTIIFCNESN